MHKAFTLATVAVTLAWGTATQAGPILDLGIAAPTSGTISYAGGTTSLSGTAITVRDVVGLGTAANAGVSRDLVDGQLDFHTGANVGFTVTTGSTGIYDFAGGGTLTLIGGLDLSDVPDGDLTDAEDLLAGSILLSGTFDTASVIALPNGDFKVVVSQFTTTLASQLAAFYGLPAGAGILYTGNLNLSFLASGGGGAAFSSTTVLSGDITLQPVPEPSSLMLAGVGVVIALAYGWRWRRRRPAA
ncbi:MAG: PEP-CTERM sorting domain-containing protein [Isosphaeraceae bacterium]|nr:PEP-CTERM sorting domain-containing protein [Isosphaeraceae bacterium]